MNKWPTIQTTLDFVSTKSKAWLTRTSTASLEELLCAQALKQKQHRYMGRQSEKNDLKKTHAISYTLGTFSVDINYIVIN